MVKRLKFGVGFRRGNPTEYTGTTLYAYCHSGRRLVHLNLKSKIDLIHGLEPQQPASKEHEILAFIHPDDHPLFEIVLRTPSLPGKPFQVNLRIVRSDGEIHYINA